MKKTIVIDCDGVLCPADPAVSYYDRVPYQYAIEWMRRLKLAGFFIRIQTARGMDRFDGDLQAIEDFHRRQLTDWLIRHGIPFDELLFGKAVTSTHYVDDNAFRVESKKGEEDWVRLGQSLGIPADSTDGGV